MKCNKRIILTLSVFLSLLLCACTSMQNKKEEVVDKEPLVEEVTTKEEPVEIIEEEISEDNPKNGVWLITKETSYPADNPDFKSVWEYHYQDGNLLIEKIQIEEPGSIKMNLNTKYEYDGTRLLQEVDYNQGQPYGTTTYEYDEAGNISKTISSSPMGYSENTYIYNLDGKLKQIVSYGGQANFELSTTKDFDEEGRLIKTTFHPTDLVFTYSYEYDEHGNIIKMITYGNDKEWAVTEYEYTYYEIDS